MTSYVIGIRSALEYTPAAEHRYPVAVSSSSVMTCGKTVIVAELVRRGVGRGSLVTPPLTHDVIVFYPPGWTGPHWTPERAGEWNRLEAERVAAKIRRREGRYTVGEILDSYKEK